MGEDYILNGKAFGEVAEALLRNDLNVNYMRPFIAKEDYQPYINLDGKAIPVANATLLYDEWKLIDDVVIKEARQRLVGIQDLRSAGLVYSLDGMSKTVLGYQDAADVGEATLSMDGITQGRRDRPVYSTNYIPLPITHGDFWFTKRELNESRNGNMPLDTTMVEMNTRKVIEKAEEILFNGASAYTYGGGTIRGYTDYPNRNTVSLTTNWDASSKTGENILDDVLSMKQTAINDRFYGPYVLYIPTAYETVLDDEFKTNSDKSVRNRLLEISQISDIRVVDTLTANNVLMVQMTSDVVRLVEGLSITTVEWETEGGMRVNFKVMAIWVPQIRSTKNGRCGVVHLS